MRQIYSTSTNLLTESWSYQGFVMLLSFFTVFFHRIYKMIYSCYWSKTRRRNSTSQSCKSGPTGNSVLNGSDALRDLDEVLQINDLIYTAGKEVKHICKALTIPECDEKKYAKVIEKFGENFVHKQDEICPAREKGCSKGQKMGHLAAVCCYVREVTSDLGGITQQLFLGDINSRDKYEEPCMVVPHINRNPVQFKIDTGADISVISVSTSQVLPECPKLKPSNAALSTLGGMLNCNGQFTVDISLENKL